MSLKIVYFGVRARAEATRMILSYAGIDYTNVTCQEYYGKGWGAVKCTAEGPLMNQLPMLVVDGTEICQSGSIVRYAAQLANLVPADPLAAAQCDAIFELAQELAPINPVVNVRRADSTPSFDDAKAAYFGNVLPSRLKSLVRALGDKDFFTGPSPMYCDFAVYHQCDLMRLVHPPVFDDSASIKAFLARFERLKGVSGYLAARPDCVDIGVRPMLEPTADPSAPQTEPRISNPEGK